MGTPNADKGYSYVFHRTIIGTQRGLNTLDRLNAKLRKCLISSRNQPKSRDLKCVFDAAFRSKSYWKFPIPEKILEISITNLHFFAPTLNLTKLVESAYYFVRH